MAPFIKLTVLALIVMICGTYTSQRVYRTSVGIDFSQFWGVGKARQAHRRALDDPYTEVPEYAEFLNEYARETGDLRLDEADRINRQLYRNGLDLTGTPLFYMLFAVMPSEYSLAFHGVEILLGLAFSAALLLLYFTRRRKLGAYFLLALFLTLDYEPLLSELRVGNVNSLQFLALAALTCYMYGEGARSTSRQYMRNSLIMAALTFLVLLKPNLLLIALMLAASIWAVRGPGVGAIATAIAGAAGMGLVGASSLFFGSSRVWLDWLHYLSGGSGKLARPVADGNYSTALIVADALRISVDHAATLLTALLAAMIIAALHAARDAVLPRTQGLGRSIIVLFRDPFMAAALGVAMTLAVSPLVWVHYNIILLLPALWFFLDSEPWSPVEALAAAAIFMSSEIVPKLLGIYSMSPYLTAFCWLPVVGCVLTRIAAYRKPPLPDPLPSQPSPIGRKGGGI